MSSFILFVNTINLSIAHNHCNLYNLRCHYGNASGINGTDFNLNTNFLPDGHFNMTNVRNPEDVFLQLKINDYILKPQVSKYHYEYRNIKVGHHNAVKHFMNGLPELLNGILLVDRYWINLKKSRFLNRNHNIYNSQYIIDIYKGFTVMKNYCIYRKKVNGRYYILVAHQEANIRGDFKWGENVILMKKSVVQKCCKINSNTIVGPFCYISSNASLGKFCILMQNVFISNFTTINNYNLFTENIKIGQNVNISSNNSSILVFYKFHKFFKFLKNTYYHFDILKNLNKKIFIGSGNLFDRSVYIGNMNVISNFNIFEEYTHLSDFTVVENSNFLNNNVFVCFDSFISDNCLIDSKIKLNQHSQLKQNTIIKK